MPLEPALFSTTNGWPVFSSVYFPTRRAAMAPERPVASGTMMWPGLFGQVSARDEAGRVGRRGAARSARRDSDLRNVGMACSLEQRPRMDSAQRAALPCVHVTVW